MHIDRLTIGVTGGIQPDRLRSLLMQSDDDGLLARFMPVWPEPVALRRPQEVADSGFFERAMARLYRMEMLVEDGKAPRPWLVPFDDASLCKAERSARRVLDAIRKNHWQRFTSREVLRLDLRGLSSVAQLNPALTLLEEGDVIRPIEPTVGQQGGRPSRRFSVNPAILAAQSN